MLNKVNLFSQKSITSFKTAAIGAAALTLSAVNLSAASTSLKLQNGLDKDKVELSVKPDTLPPVTQSPGVPYTKPEKAILPPAPNIAPEPIQDTPPENVKPKALPQRPQRPGVPYTKPEKAILPPAPNIAPEPIQDTPPENVKPKALPQRTQRP